MNDWIWMWWGMKGDSNEEIHQNQPFCAFQTFAWPTNRPTDRPTNRRTWPLIEVRGRTYKGNSIRITPFRARNPKSTQITSKWNHEFWPLSSSSGFKILHFHFEFDTIFPFSIIKLIGQKKFLLDKIRKKRKKG